MRRDATRRYATLRYATPCYTGRRRRVVRPPAGERERREELLRRAPDAVHRRRAAGGWAPDYLKPLRFICCLDFSMFLLDLFHIVYIILDFDGTLMPFTGAGLRATWWDSLHVRVLLSFQQPTFQRFTNIKVFSAAWSAFRSKRVLIMLAGARRRRRPPAEGAGGVPPGGRRRRDARLQPGLFKGLVLRVGE